MVSENGIVTLTGRVLSELDKTSIEEDAEAVMGRTDRINNRTIAQRD